MTHNRLLRSVYNTIVLLLLIGGAWLVLDNFVHFGRVEFTDNATVQQHITPVNTRVQGFIKEIRFEEFQPVHKGDTLVIIEDAEYRLRLAQAEADLEGVQSGRQATSQGIHTTQSTMSVTDASVEEARVQLDNARREDQRYAQLLQGDAVTPQHFFQALCIFNMLHMFVGGLIGAALQARGLNYYVGDGFARYSGWLNDVLLSRQPFDFAGFMDGFVEQMLAKSVKTLYGWTLYAALFFALLMLLWDIPGVRRQVKHMQTWPRVGLQVMGAFRRKQRLRRIRHQRAEVQGLRL